MKVFVILLIAALVASSAHAQTLQTPAAPATRVRPSAIAVRVPTPPVLDGRLDDAAWSRAEAITSFTQLDPVEGAPSSERTEVRIVYDNEAIYVGARLAERGGVTSRLGRRDMTLASSDWLRISFDTYQDRRIGVRFDVNPDGVRRDATIGAGGSTGGGGGGGGNAALGGADGDLAWDAVWDAATSVDGDGWIAEIKIPFSQLRFARADVLIWGLQIERLIARTQEYSVFSFTPKAEPGGVAAFGDLSGLSGVRPGRPLELVPYALSEADFLHLDGNRLRDSTHLGGNAGLDARYRLTSNMVLSATVNPDFGQVEVDPAVINLTAFETRYEERRPFFVEGASTFRFGGNIQGPGANAAALLYSRRIGRAPQVRLSATETDVPGVTDILGAVKVSGRTGGGWSVGLLNAVTREERGRYVDADGVTQQALVEPQTNYLVGRVNREFRRGLSTVGGMFTSTNRDMSDPGAAAALRSRASTGGLDFTHEWANRSWGLGGYVVGSQVSGSAAAITSTQRSSGRYYQRPDSRALSLDPTATSLGGYAGAVQLRRQSGLHWTGDAWVAAVSPGFEINDTGFLQRSDRIATGGAVRYNERRPGRLFRAWNLSAVQNHTVNYDGDWIEKILRFGGGLTFLNYWSVNLNGTQERERLDDRFTRGGPLAIKPPSWTARVGMDTDPRRPIGLSVDVDTGGDRVGSRTRGVTVALDVRTSPRWNLSFGPDMRHVQLDTQYVSSVADSLMTSTFGRRYIFAALDQTEVSLVTRLNYTFTPDLTFELYLQPLVSNGAYGTPREFQAPSSYRFATYGTDIGSLTKAGNSYTIDPDGPGSASSFSLNDPSFTTRSLRGNAVLRWEYRPGSTMYFVWQQERRNPERLENFRVGHALGTLLDAESNNVLVLKWSYRFNP